MNIPSHAPAVEKGIQIFFKSKEKQTSAIQNPESICGKGEATGELNESPCRRTEARAGHSLAHTDTSHHIPVTPGEYWSSAARLALPPAGDTLWPTHIFWQILGALTLHNTGKYSNVCTHCRVLLAKGLIFLSCCPSSTNQPQSPGGNAKECFTVSRSARNCRASLVLPSAPTAAREVLSNAGCKTGLVATNTPQSFCVWPHKRWI